MSIFFVSIYFVIQTLFAPLFILGFFILLYKQVYKSRIIGASSTAIAVINSRWVMDIFGLRKDTAAVNLVHKLPNTSAIGLWLIYLPSFLLYKVTGKNWFFPSCSKPGKEGLKDTIYTRTMHFDSYIEKSKNDVDQFILLGAGFDTRCYEKLSHSKLKLFELDQEKTQNLKLQYLQSAGIEYSKITYVPVNFSSQEWTKKLLKSGYNPQKKSIFLWEGVTLYLSESDIIYTLTEIRNNSASGSIILADFYSLSFIKGDLSPGMKSLLKLLKYTNEELKFGIDPEDFERKFEAFIVSLNLSLKSCKFMGQNTKMGSWMVVAEILT